MVPADEAVRLGLFSRVVRHERLAEETRAVATMLAAKPPIALALVKRAVYASERATLPEMLAMEMEHQITCFTSADAKEGLHAFLDKRDPTFRGE
jgi:enoyl-CoA hydratase/carnithine racemase